MAELFNALTINQAREVVAQHLTTTSAVVKVPLLESLGRRLAAAVRSPEDVPGFDRSTVDGYALRARDTFGATESMPAYVEITGEVLMGQAPQEALKIGQAWRIATGGMLPPGADAVVMVEYTEELDALTIGVTSPVAPGDNIVRRGEDIGAIEIALSAGHRIRPQDLGLLAAIGVTEVPVVQTPTVGIISTGDELVIPEAKPNPGQVRDINSYALYGAVQECGGLPRLYGIVRDVYADLEKLLRQALQENDLVLLSGGSSVGTRDVAAKAIDAMGEPGVLFHGIAVKPGKPTVGAVIDGKPVFGLPGHPTSAMVIFDLMVAPLVRNGCYPVGGAGDSLDYPVRAVITRNLHSAAGRDDFVRVKLTNQNGQFYAEPVLGKSGLIGPMVKADGLVHIPAGKEGVEAGTLVEAKIF